MELGRKRREFFPRINPMRRFNPDKFVQRYRIDKETAKELARDYKASQYFTGGDPRGGGITAEERVSIMLSVNVNMHHTLYVRFNTLQGCPNPKICTCPMDNQVAISTCPGSRLRCPEDVQHMNSENETCPAGRGTPVVTCPDVFSTCPGLPDGRFESKIFTT